MTPPLPTVQSGAYYIIIKDWGILKKGMRCYCYAHDGDNIILFFSQPIVHGVKQIKLSKKVSHILEKL